MTPRATTAALLACAIAACSRTPGPVDFAIDAPAPGTVVRPGQDVHFRLAVDGSRNTAYHLWMAGTGATVGRAEGSGIATVPWTVPRDAAPGQRFDFAASARDTATRLEARAATHVVVAPVRAAWTDGASPPALAADAEAWEGTWTGTARGAIYDDECRVAFDFAVAPDGTIAGAGTAVLATRPVQAAGCAYAHAQTPARFPVTVTGRRDGGHFALRLEGPGLVGRRVVTAACAGGTGPATPYDAFGMVGVHAAGLAPRVPARDGGIARVSTRAATLAVRYETAVRRARR